MIQSRRIRQCFGRLVDRKCSKVGVSGSASEGWLTGNVPKLAYQAVLWKVGRLEMIQSRRIRQCFGDLVDQAVLWKVSRLEMIQSWRIRQCFGDLVDRILSEVGVSGSASEGWLTGSDPK